MGTLLSGSGDRPCYLRFPVCEAACVPPSIISAVVANDKFLSAVGERCA